MDANSGWLVYEIDDNMSDQCIPKYNRGRKAFEGEHIQSNIKKMLNAADFITVTEGNNYVVRITYKSTVAGDAWLNFGTWDASMPKYGFPIVQSDEYTTVDVDFPSATFAAEGNAHVLLQVGKLVGTITIQKVEVFESAPAA